MINNKTKVITGKDTRLSYFNGWEPKSINGGAEKYSVSVLIPKDDVKTIKAIEEAINAAIEEGVGKFGGKKPNKATIKLPLRDGDIERDGDWVHLAEDEKRVFWRKTHVFIEIEWLVSAIMGLSTLKSFLSERF